MKRVTNFYRPQPRGGNKKEALLRTFPFGCLSLNRPFIITRIKTICQITVPAPLFSPARSEINQPPLSLRAKRGNHRVEGHSPVNPANLLPYRFHY
jgi:hypothetical protein